MLSVLKSSFKALLPSLKNILPILLVVIVVLLNVAIWWAGPWISYDEQRPLESLGHRGLASVFFLWLVRRHGAYLSGGNYTKLRKTDARPKVS